jgi:hypothetical protein
MLKMDEEEDEKNTHILKREREKKILRKVFNTQAHT